MSPTSGQFSVSLEDFFHGLTAALRLTQVRAVLPSPRHDLRHLRREGRPMEEREQHAGTRA